MKQTCVYLVFIAAGLFILPASASARSPLHTASAAAEAQAMPMQGRGGNQQDLPKYASEPAARKLNEMEQNQKAQVERVKRIIEEKKEVAERKKMELRQKRDELDPSTQRLSPKRERMVQVKEDILAEARSRMVSRRVVDPALVEAIDSNCATAAGRMATLSARFETLHKGQIIKYENLLKRLNQVVANFMEEGYDTTGLESSIVGLDELVQKLNTDHALFVEKLQTARSYPCGKTSDSTAGGRSFRELFIESRDALLVVREDIVSIREYYRASVRPELINLKEQKKARNAGGGAAKESSPETSAPSVLNTVESTAVPRQEMSPAR